MPHELAEELSEIFTVLDDLLLRQKNLLERTIVGEQFIARLLGKTYEQYRDAVTEAIASQQTKPTAKPDPSLNNLVKFDRFRNLKKEN